MRIREQKVNKEEKLTLSFHRNLLILLGKLRSFKLSVSNSSGLLTEGFISPAHFHWTIKNTD